MRSSRAALHGASNALLRVFLSGRAPAAHCAILLTGPSQRSTHLVSPSEPRVSSSHPSRLSYCACFRRCRVLAYVSHPLVFRALARAALARLSSCTTAPLLILRASIDMEVRAIGRRRHGREGRCRAGAPKGHGLLGADSADSAQVDRLFDYTCWLAECAGQGASCSFTTLRGLERREAPRLQRALGAGCVSAGRLQHRKCGSLGRGPKACRDVSADPNEIHRTPSRCARRVDRASRGDKGQSGYVVSVFLWQRANAPHGDGKLRVWSSQRLCWWPKTLAAVCPW